MVFDSEKGCVRDQIQQACDPELTPVSLKLEEFAARWSLAITQLRHAPVQSDLDKIYDGLLLGRKVKELPRKSHPIFPGFTPYGLEAEFKTSLLESDLGYRCGYEKVIYAGRPEIQESPERRGHIDFNCGICKDTMYSEEVEPNRCKGF